MLKSLNDVEILDKSKILGEGAFSEVIKIRLKTDNKLYALKKVSSPGRQQKSLKSRFSASPERNQLAQDSQPP